MSFFSISPRLVLFVLLVFSVDIVQGQFAHRDVFKGFGGDNLFQLVVDNYKPFVVLPYSQARDSLFLKVDAVNRVVECVYTGLKVSIPEGVDPTDALFMNGVDNGINTEHAYPQSLGSGQGNSRSDMHHLFPTRTRTNNARGNKIFAEIPDAQTTSWHYLTTETSVIPTTNRDLYSEDLNAGNGAFEPRESSKGDFARAMFYIHTMYRDQVQNSNATFFEVQRATLCNWHFLDPVDEKEWNRTFGIANYQEGKVNPYVLDCSLASRMYCTQIDDACSLLTSISEVEVPRDADFSAPYPNPVAAGQRVFLKVNGSLQADRLLLNLTDISGRRQMVQWMYHSTDQLIELSMPYEPGMYFLTAQKSADTPRQSFKVLVR